MPVDVSHIAEVFWFGVALVVFSVIGGVILEVAWTSLQNEKRDDVVSRIPGHADLPTTATRVNRNEAIR